MLKLSKTTNGSSVINELKRLLLKRGEGFWDLLFQSSRDASSYNELVKLSSMRKRALKMEFHNSAFKNTPTARIAIVGGSTLYPTSEFVEHLLEASGLPVKMMIGDYNNYRSEILDESSRLYDFEPDFVIIIPEEQSCRYPGRLTDRNEDISAEVKRAYSETLDLCRVLRNRAKSEIILCNFLLPAFVDLGQLRTKSPASDWNFRKSVNLGLANNAPNYVQICDLEFLAYRLGGLHARDEKAWFESKQLCSPMLQVEVAKEISHLILSQKKTPKKVLVLDLDNTLWGGVVGDDGMDGIEIGDTSPRGEAFKAFQSYIKSLTERGVLLGVCSKNDLANAIEPFQKHPEMVLREEHFVSFKANWEPKAQNLIEMADELNLGLDSFVFVDDNPAEVEIVRQFAPEVEAILLGPDPSEYVKKLMESRLFERFSITDEDGLRTEQYRIETNRKSLEASAVDMDSYLKSLEMVGSFKEFNTLDLPRITQLINKSNQFNLTTKRRIESEIETLMRDPRFFGFSMRLSDKFGDHGLISVVIGRFTKDSTFEIDTWLMSCRVLKRQVEEEVMNEIMRLAKQVGAERVHGLYIPTPKNGMVENLYPSLGFGVIEEDEIKTIYELPTREFNNKPTFISIESRSYSDE